MFRARVSESVASDRHARSRLLFEALDADPPTSLFLASNLLLSWLSISYLRNIDYRQFSHLPKLASLSWPKAYATPTFHFQ